MSRIKKREMPRYCPAAFLAPIILPHPEIASVPKSDSPGSVSIAMRSFNAGI
jgi:hypothetical protein